MEESPKVRLLATNPFRLKIICELYESAPNLTKTKGKFSLPENPGKLLEKYIQALEDQRLKRSSPSHQLGKGRQGWREVIGKLAAKNATAIQLDEFYLSNEERECLGYAESIGVIQWINDQIIFIHQQLQEYFSAIWLNNEIERNRDFNSIKDLFYQDTWDEPFYILVGIVGDRYLSQLVYQIGQVDPFLAARCIGISVTRLSPTILDWFADYLLQGLQDPDGGGDNNLYKKTLKALGDMEYEKCFEKLSQPDIWQSIEASISTGDKEIPELYYQTIARFDTPAAAEFIITRLNQKISEPSDKYWQRPNYEIYTLALARMHTPKAHQFLSEHLQDIRIFPAVVKAVGMARLPEAEQLREILEGTSCMIIEKGQDYFQHVTQAVGRAGLTELIPDFEAV